MSPVLLDTHLLIWAAADDPRLGAATRRALLDPVQEIFFSVVSIWEVVIKLGLDRTNFQVDARRLRESALRAGLGELPVRASHALEVRGLPTLHQDPFDRMLIAQARVEGCELLTVDTKVLQYGSPVRKA